MPLTDFVANNKKKIIKTWEKLAVERLGLHLEKSELLNDLPNFLDDLVTALANSSHAWPDLDNAHSHGRQRMRLGINMSVLTEEMLIITEAICVVAKQQQRDLSNDEVISLTRALARGTAASINAYSTMRDKELAKQASDHFSFVAHELRTPLQTALMSAALIRETAGKAREESLQKLDRALAQTIELVDNTLVQVRLSGETQLVLQSFPVEELLQAAFYDIEGHIHLKGLKLKTDITPFELNADRRLLLSALTNLIKNAIKFTGHGGTIYVSATQQDERALFEVADQCGGMPEDLPGRLFQPYVQGGQDQTGFGLGLMIVKQATDAHQGRVSINNRPGDGCSFVIEIPIKASKA